MTAPKRAPWADCEYAHLLHLVENQFALFRRYGLGRTFWQVVAEEMNRVFGSNRTGLACETVYSKLANDVIPRPDASALPDWDERETATLEEVRDLVLALKRDVENRDKILLDALLGPDEKAV